MSGLRPLLPPHWPRPQGYSAGLAAEGLVFVAGMVGWDTEGRFSSGFADQFRQTLENTLAVLSEGGCGPEHIARMTWYILDRDQYLEAGPEMGRIWRELMGRNYPVMAVVIVAGLIEKDAKIEIETTAIASSSVP